MTFNYDKELNIIRILFDSNALVEESDDYDGVILDWDSNHRPVGIEILDAANKLEFVNDIGAFLVDSGYTQKVAFK
ncbi:MAG: DUF2283 domain-containing protein [Janthinobacterium lividum]